VSEFTTGEKAGTCSAVCGVENVWSLSRYSQQRSTAVIGWVCIHQIRGLWWGQKVLISKNCRLERIYKHFQLRKENPWRLLFINFIISSMAKTCSVWVFSQFVAATNRVVYTADYWRHHKARLLHCEAGNGNDPDLHLQDSWKILPQIHFTGW